MKAIVTVVLLWVAALLLTATGWIMNIVALVHMLDGAVNALFIARIVGIPVVPLGVILGWFA